MRPRLGFWLRSETALADGIAMPFPLAHPAAILPFRRYCPCWLNFPALVVGSLVPDLSYCSGNIRLDELAHRPEGAVIFALPAGLLCLAVFYAFRARIG